jgi:hypothetical protein
MLAAGVVKMLAGRKQFNRLRARAAGFFKQAGVQPVTSFSHLERDEAVVRPFGEPVLKCLEWSKHRHSRRESSTIV